MKPLIKIFKIGQNTDKIELTEKELQKILDEAYETGYNDGQKHCSYHYCPYQWTWTNTSTTGNDLTIQTPYLTTSNAITNSGLSTDAKIAEHLGTYVTCEHPHDLRTYTQHNIQSESD